MPKQDDDAREVQESLEILGMTLKAGGDAPEAQEPREEAFDLPPALVAAKRATVLAARIVVAANRTD